MHFYSGAPMHFLSGVDIPPRHADRRRLPLPIGV
jgi:hypothetical protein